MPRKGIKRDCPHCGAYGRVATREPIPSRPGETFIAASCLKCKLSDRTRARFARRYVVKCRDCGEDLTLAELVSYDGRCYTCANARASEQTVPGCAGGASSLS